MARQITIPDNTEVLAQQLVETVKNAQRAASHYSHLRSATCPPSREFPVDFQDPEDLERQRVVWRETYPARGEATFTVPAVQRFLETL